MVSPKLIFESFFNKKPEEHIASLGIPLDKFKNDLNAKSFDDYDHIAHSSGMSMMNNVSNISSNEKRSISRWTDPDGYKQMNGHLRGNSNNPNAQAHIDNIDSAMAKNPIQSDMTVYRGIHGPHQANFDALKEGDTFYNKGYTATTADPLRSSHYTRDGGSMLAISVPKGNNAVYASHPEINSHTAEREVLLPHNSHFQYHGSETLTVPEHDYSGYPTGRIKTIKVHKVSAIPKTHDMSMQLDKV